MHAHALNQLHNCLHSMLLYIARTTYRLCVVSLCVAVGKGDGLVAPLPQRVVLPGDSVAAAPVHLGGTVATATKPKEVGCVLKKAATEVVQMRHNHHRRFHGNQVNCYWHSLERTVAL